MQRPPNCPKNVDKKWLGKRVVDHNGIHFCTGIHLWLQAFGHHCLGSESLLCYPDPGVCTGG